jgi:hypothetical protein
MKPLGISVLIKIVRALTVEKRTINMSNMGKPSGEAIILKYMKESTLKRSNLDVNNMEKLLGL